jgi:hypothetical protein
VIRKIKGHDFYAANRVLPGQNIVQQNPIHKKRTPRIKLPINNNARGKYLLHYYLEGA